MNQKQAMAQAVKRTPRDLANDLQKQADQAAIEARISEAVVKYGRELKVGMTLSQAFEIIANCLEDGLESFKKSKKR